MRAAPPTRARRTADSESGRLHPAAPRREDPHVPERPGGGAQAGHGPVRGREGVDGAAGAGGVLGKLGIFG